MATKARKQFIDTRGQTPQSHSVWAWHPLVHKRFGEELFYFLLVVKPFDRAKHEQRVTQLMEKFGVTHYCSYQLFGSFDSMLRVWLPPAAALDFKREAETITHVRLVQSFRVEDKWRCWLTDQASKKANEDQIKAFADALNGDDVRAQQEGRLEGSKLRLLQDHALLWRKEAESKSSGRIKAFIALSYPDVRLPQDLESHVKKEINDLLTHSDFGFVETTLMFGQGFCWALTKVVAENLNALGRFIHAASGKVGIYGISTDTHLVVDFPPPLEGESVSATALSQLQMANPLVQQFLPELYQARGITPSEKGRFEEFVNKLLRSDETVSDSRSKLSDEDLEAMKKFLRAAVADDKDDAFGALYPPIRSAERRLREPIGRLAGEFYPGKVPALLELLRQSKGHPPDSLAKMSVRDIFQAAHAILKGVKPQDGWLAKWKDNDFKEISDVRNTVMHDNEFRPRKEWEHYAHCMLKLFSIRNGFLEFYDELEKQMFKTNQ